MPAPGQHVFSEKVALVTNSTGAIGRAVSMQLGLYGSYVISSYGPASESDLSAVGELRNLGTIAHAFEAELRTAAGAAELVGKVEGVFGRLDLLVNCVDVPFGDDPGLDDEEAFSGIIDSVIRPVYFLTRESIRLLGARPKAVIVNVLKYDANDSDGPLLEAANAAVENLTRSFAKTLPSSLRVNAVSVREDRASEGMSEPGLDPDLFRPRPAVDPDDVARAVIYLLSSEAKAVNGQVLEIG